MIYITPDNKKRANSKYKSIFFGGTIDNGDSINWQVELSKLLEQLNINIYSPRRLQWNPNFTNDELSNQIRWEQKHLDKANIIIMVLLDDSKSPISLLELGLYAKSKKMIVFCTDKFYRYDNVRLTCEKYNIPLINSTNIDIIAKNIISYI